MIRVVLLLGLAAATPVQAAGPVDPDWPCIQRRQPHLSMAQVWGGPVPDEATLALAQSPEIQAVAQAIALRRTPIDAVEAAVTDFAADHDAQALVALFAATFDHVNLTRDRVMAGITRYAHKQATLEAEISALRREFAALEAAEPQDFDRIDAVERELDWSMRIFQDRQQSLTYVCETPVILEQRAFALGRAAEALLPK
jgi:prefoldin subunit 5